MGLNNLFIFCADALRRDHLPGAVANRGNYVDTVAAGTTTPESFSSIVSGLYPTQHQVFSFTHRLEPKFNILNHLSERGYDSQYYEFRNGGVADVLGVEYSEENPIADIEPPYCLLERDTNSHAPYDMSHEGVADEERTEYFESTVIDWDRLWADYQAGCNRVASRFEQRLETLESRGLLEDTLVVFTSDHGELLGEYSEFSHGDPVVPELVEVPTVLIHPEGRSVEADLMSHVDLMPTIVDCLDVERPWNSPGESVYEHGSSRKITEFVSASHTLDEWSLQDLYEYRVRCVWGRSGGYAINETGLSKRLLHGVRQAPLFNPLRGRDAVRAFSALYHHTSKERTFGSPEFSLGSARDTLAAIDEMDIELTRTMEALSDDSRDQLRRLGYL